MKPESRPQFLLLVQSQILVQIAYHKPIENFASPLLHDSSFKNIRLAISKHLLELPFKLNWCQNSETVSRTTDDVDLACMAAFSRPPPAQCLSFGLLFHLPSQKRFIFQISSSSNFKAYVLQFRLIFMINFTFSRKYTFWVKQQICSIQPTATSRREELK